MAKRYRTPGGDVPLLRLANWDFTAWEPGKKRRNPRASDVTFAQLSQKELAKRRAAARRDAKKRGVKVTFEKVA